MKSATGMQPLGVAIVGCGNVTEWFHAPAYESLTSRFDVRAVVDPNEGPRERVRALLGLPADRAFASAEEALRMPDIDVVDAATPPRHRPAVVELAAERGLHVIAEKPLATSLREVVRMKETCAQAGIVAATLHNHVHLPDNRVAREIIESGELGDIDLVVLNRLSMSDIPGTADYDPQWRHRIAAGGGVLLDYMHFVYVAESILGEEIEEVAAHVFSDGDVERTATCLFRTRSSAANVNVAWGVGPNSIEIRGTRGYLTVGDDGGHSARHAVVTTAEGRQEIPLADTPNPFAYTFANVFADFADAIETGSPPAATLADGQHALEVVLAAYKSAVEHATVSLPLAEGDPTFEDGLAALVRTAS